MFVKDKIHDRQDTYWGYMRTLVNEGQYCAKIIKMAAGTQSSLEYHVSKQETYILLKGDLIVGMRGGRAVNSRVYMSPGDTLTIFPGQMHMRIAVTDVTILEVSTNDNPFDTMFVEDGHTYKHIVGGKQ